MISHIGRVSLETYKTVKGIQKEEVEGEMVEKEVEVTLRFDYIFPIGTPYDLILEVVEEMKKEVEMMRANQQKAADDAKKKESNCQDESECVKKVAEEETVSKPEQN